MKAIVLALTGLLIAGGAIAENVWWSLSHNFTNVSCSNVIYHAQHLQSCAIWLRAQGIQDGVCIPIIIIGLFAFLGGGMWLAVQLLDMP